MYKVKLNVDKYIYIYIYIYLNANSKCLISFMRKSMLVNGL
jgi:hypothetical protein